MRPSCSVLVRLASAPVKPTPTVEFNKTFENGQAHVTAINAVTDEHSVYKLTIAKNFKPVKVKSFYPLPESVTEGLKNALVECKRAPKVIQHEADQLSEKLQQRRFPANPKEVQAARRIIVKKLKKDEEDFLPPEAFDQKVKRAQEKQLHRDVAKQLKKTRYNWKPLEFQSKEDSAVFTLSRIAPYYAEMRKVLTEFERIDYAPKSVLDFGSGCGSAYFAARDTWGDAVQEYTLIDTSDTMSQFSMDIMRGKEDNVPRNVYFRRALVPSLQNKYDVVFVHRTLIEIGSHEKRLELISTLWQRTNRFLVIVESELEDSFEALNQARNFILTNGVKMDSKVLRELLNSKNLLTEEVQKILVDKQMSYSEKYYLIRAQFPDPSVLPTFIETGYVFAPCPHDQGCPHIDLPQGRKACKFSVKWQEIRADNKSKARRADGTGRSQYSYVILEKGIRPAGPSPARLLDKSKASGCITCKTCTAFDGLQRFPVSKRAGPLYQLAKGAAVGALFPVQGEIAHSEGDYQIVRKMLKELDLQ